LFLSFLLDVLGSPSPPLLPSLPPPFERYAGAIRSEYKHVPRLTYLTKRAEVLSSMLGEEGGGRWIYASDFYRQELEEQARDNLLGEIQMLREGVIPYEEQKGEKEGEGGKGEI